MDKPDFSLFPAEPGVYLYKDASGHILYVGKARRLRHRLASYFRDSASLSAKTNLMLQHAASIDTLRTSTEKEALLLEASLIKKHRPRYNIVLRDDKEYLLFRIGSEHPYPKIEIVRRNKRVSRDKKARYFGPFSSSLAARETWRLVHKQFSLRRCRDSAFANRTRPCLYHDMGQCLAPCVFPVAQEEYQVVLDKAALLLSGKSRELVEKLRREMESASDNMRFEEAAMIRDQIRAVERTLERQSVVLPENRNLDLVGVAQEPEGLALGVVFVRGGLLLDGRNFFWPGLSVEDTPELLSGFLAQFYLDRQDFGESIPPRIVVPWLPDASYASLLASEEPPPEDATAEARSYRALEAAIAEIRGGAVHIARARDKDEDSLLLMAASNAREAMKATRQMPMADLLAKRLHTSRSIRRIEAVDISHTGGRQTRAGIVIFEDEQPVRQQYRTYALDADLHECGAEAGDDYAALAAFARRRVRSAIPWPDLLLVDGGKGQLAAVQRTFVEAGVEPGLLPKDAFVLAAIAKARDEDGRADRRAGNVSDRIFLPDRGNPLTLAPGSAELLFLQRVRDTVHDFVIGRHRKARAAATLAGELTRLPGVGPQLARRLFDRFGSLTAMGEAGEDALAKVPGIGRVRAKVIAQRLAMLLGNAVH